MCLLPSVCVMCMVAACGTCTEYNVRVLAITRATSYEYVGNIQSVWPELHVQLNYTHTQLIHA